MFVAPVSCSWQQERQQVDAYRRAQLVWTQLCIWNCCCCCCCCGGGGGGGEWNGAFVICPPLTPWLFHRSCASLYSNPSRNTHRSKESVWPWSIWMPFGSLLILLLGENDKLNNRKGNFIYFIFQSSIFRCKLLVQAGQHFYWKELWVIWFPSSQPSW